ncbi:hypothetical protein NC652_034063 [Populus alba x Populus x berolinensis]|nr:hypothetical protein NC652_034063 [Populus alba x Populus x berolinensis]
MSRLSYTRVPVEVNLMSDLPYSIEVTLPNGSMIHQPILSISLTPASDLAGPRADKGKYVVVSGALGYSTSHSTGMPPRRGTQKRTDGVPSKGEGLLLTPPLIHEDLLLECERDQQSSQVI